MTVTCNVALRKSSTAISNMAYFCSSPHKRLPIHRYIVVIFVFSDPFWIIFSSPLGLLVSDIRKHNTASAGARGRK